MKKTRKIALGLALILGITACGANSNDPQKAEDQAENAPAT